MNLGEGLQEIGKKAFVRCKSLRRILISPAVTAINEEAIYLCSSLTSVVFCDEIEEFLSAESIREWWDHGIHERSLSTYCFFVQRSIPQRLSLVPPRDWQTNNHWMLRRIPTISPKVLNSHYDLIDSMLSVYGDLDDTAAPMLLEVALWKSKVFEQFEGSNETIPAFDITIQCHTDSLTTVAIIIPNVWSFLSDGDNSNNVVGRDEDDSDSYRDGR